VARKTSLTKQDEKAAKKAEKAEKKEQKKGKRIWKLMGTGSAVAAGVVTAKALDATWKTATGHAAPTKPEHPDLGTRESLAWAALSGMAVGVAKTYATRRAATYWVKSTGRLPPGMPKEAYKHVAKGKR
jgi:negative regulator of sigma E activity